MVSYQELHRQNHKITELTNILQHLLGDRSLCDSEVTCNLFFDYVDAVKAHMAVTDSEMYSKLLGAGDQKLSNIANRFMGGSREINRIFSAYLKRWCKLRTKQLVIKQYDEFMQDTQEMFDMVLDRIQAETEHLYPAVRKVTGDEREVA
jgi:succinate dehydrogenase flavin-adding protein (antitoxin of CptAB toxin-antitoxin module)